MLSYESAAVASAATNPRWIYCHADLGRRPLLYEYIGWLRERQQEFIQAEKRGCLTWTQLVEHDGPAVQLRFDAFLQARSHRLLTESVRGEVQRR